MARAGTFVSGAAGAVALAGGLALAATLLLAPGAARAADECGALNSGNSFTEECPAATYTNGIVYWNQANAVTLTVPGTATTTTITAAPNGGWDIGIVVGTRTHASTARNIALTVGGTGTSVNIVQASSPQATLWYRNTGILVRQRSGGEATTTVDVKSGVTIGTSATDKLNNRGIDVNVENTGAGAVSVTSGATIYSENDGIQVVSRAAGAVTVANSGAITTDGDGIFARTTGQDADGANAGVSIAHSAGAIAAEGGGIEAHVGHARQETDTEHDDYVAPMNAGLAKVAVTGGSVSSTSTAIRALNYEAGSVEVSVSEGVTLTSTAGRGIHAALTDAGNPGGTVSVTQAGTIKAAKGGINVIRGGGAGAVTVDNSGAIEAGDDGIFVVARGGGGAVTVTNSGAIGKADEADAEVARGIFVSHDGEGVSGGVTVESSGAITATDHGILAQVKGQDEENANVGVTVTHSAGAIVVASDEAIDDGAQGVKEGIVVRVGNHRAETDAHHADYVRPVNAGLAKAAVTGGSVTSKGNAVEVANYEAGGVEIDVSAGVELTSTHDQGIEADLRDVGNASGTIEITQAGTISAAKDGVSAHVAWAGGAGPDRAIDVTWTGTFTARESERAPIANIARAVQAVRQQAVNDLDIHYTQGYAGIAAGVMKWPIFMDVVARSDDPGAFADKAAQDALFAADADAATKARAAAIVAQFKEVLGNEALGTIPGAADVDADGDGSYSDAEITAYLSADDAARRALLRNVLAQSLTEEEAAVLQALLAGDDVDAALDDAGFSEAYKTAVKALVGNHNTGDVRVAMNGGSIDSSGDGIRAWFATPHDRNGGIEVTVAGGASVTGGEAGIYVANAGTGSVTVAGGASVTGGEAGIYVANAGTGSVTVAGGASVTGGEAGIYVANVGAGLRIEKKYTSRAVQNENDKLDADDLVTLPGYLDQVVTVQGTVTGGSDAAVHLAGGGALIVTGAGKLVAGSSGRAVLVNDPGPAVIFIEGEVTGGEGPEGAPAPAAVHLTGGGSVTVGLTGRVRAGGARSAIRGDNAPTAVIVHSETATPKAAAEALERIEGGIVFGEGIEKSVTIAEVRDDGTIVHAVRVPVSNAGVVEDFSNLRPATCDIVFGDRCRLYEALPSILLAMNDLPSYAERTSAARDAHGAWARVEMARGEWQADKATTPGKLAYDHRRTGGRAGVDFIAGETGRVGVSVHVLKGKAEMSGVGEAELDGKGAGLSATWLVGDLYVDVQGAAMWYDARLDPATGSGRLVDEVDGRGHALDLDVGNRMVMGEDLVVTPRAGLGWSKIDLDDFTDEVGSGASARVSVRDARSTKGRVGVMVETAVGSEDAPGRVFGSVDVEHEFKDETSVDVSGSLLETTVKPTGVRLGLGGEFSLGEDVVLRVRADYTTRGGDTSEYGGGMELNLRF